MRTLARRFPFLFYYVAALAIAVSVMVIYAALVALDPTRASMMATMFQWVESHRLYSNAFTIARFAGSTGTWSALLILVFAVAPTVAACLTVASRDGTAGLRRWAARLKPAGSGVSAVQAGRTYALLAVVYGVGLAWYLWLTWRYGTPAEFSRVWATLGGSLPAVLAVAAIGPFLDEGGLLEEMGWRGYALPLFQERMSPLSAAVVLGLLWGAWHLPREVLQLGGVSLSGWLGGQGMFALLTVSLSIVIAYFVNRTGGSVLPAIIIHGGTNVWSKAASGQAHAMFHTDVRTWIVVAGALAVVGCAGRNLGRTPVAAAAGTSST